MTHPRSEAEGRCEEVATVACSRGSMGRLPAAEAPNPKASRLQARSSGSMDRLPTSGLQHKTTTQFGSINSLMYRPRPDESGLVDLV